MDRASYRSWYRMFVPFYAARMSLFNPDFFNSPYNQTVELLTSEDAPHAVKTKVRDVVLPTLPPWHRSALREVLVEPIFDACRAVSAAKKFNAKLAAANSRGECRDDDFARVRFRSRKNPRQIFTVQTNCASNTGIYRTRLGDMRMAENLPTPENSNICRLSLRYGHYHLAVPYDEKLPHARENQA